MPEEVVFVDILFNKRHELAHNFLSSILINLVPKGSNRKYNNAIHRATQFKVKLYVKS